MKQLFNDNNRTIVDTNLFDMIQKDQLRKHVQYQKSEEVKDNTIVHTIVLTKISTSYDENCRPFTDTFTITLWYNSERKRNTDYNKIMNNHNKIINSYVPYKKEAK